VTIRFCAILTGLGLLALLIDAQPARGEYLRIDIDVYGMDCGLCARGVAAYVGRMHGVKSVDVSLKKGLLQIVLEPGNTLKMADLRKRIRDNGFRSTDAKVTAKGEFDGARFVVSGCGDSYELQKAESPGTVELTFAIPTAE
jgi:copper chaperone CopZ